MRKMILIAAATLIASAGVAAAYDRKSDIDRRMARQTEAIEAGRQDGSLTLWESYVLRREQARIAKLESDALADGKLSKDEHNTIREAQANAARNIKDERSDSQVRGFWWRLLRY